MELVSCGARHNVDRISTVSASGLGSPRRYIAAVGRHALTGKLLHCPQSLDIPRTNIFVAVHDGWIEVAVLTDSKQHLAHEIS